MDEENDWELGIDEEFLELESWDLDDIGFDEDIIQVEE